MNKYQKRSSSLLIILSVLCSVGLVATTSATTPASEMANDFPFPTATTIPTPTPVPTVTPVPTPRPTPSAWPNLDMYLRSTANSNAPKVTIYGTLSYNRTSINDTSVYVGFSADNGTTWENFTLIKTKADGSYQTVWVPESAGNYQLCVQWDGNLTLHWLNTTAGLALTSDGAGNQFSVVSNSTLTDFAYNSANKQLTFRTNGTSHTTGYMYVCIPKTLVNDIQTVQLKMDGNTAAFGSEAQDDIWVISAVYSQSEHAFVVQLPAKTILSPNETPYLAIVIAIIIIAVILAVAIVVRRKRKTAATVAAILKNDRPTY